MSRLTDVITAPDAETRNRSLDAFCRAATLEELLQPKAYEKLEKSTAALCDEMKKIVKARHVSVVEDTQLK